MKKHVYIIAEVGPNHNGDVNIALKMVEEIAKTGVDAIKFQMTNPYALYSDDSFKATYQKNNDKAPTAREMSLRIQLKPEEHLLVYKRCKDLGIDYICTAFDIDSLKFLDDHCDMSYYKIASGEIFSLDIIDYIAQHNKPIILSTGMATYDEINTSLNLLNEYGKHDITILHCISAYPAKYEEVNLLNMIELRDRFGYKVGFSDHTIGNDCAIAAVAMGACMIEKHVTYDKKANGPDHKASITIEELMSLVQSIRHVESAIGVKEREFSETQREISRVARKSVVSRHPIKMGDVIHKEDICYKRPGIGVLPIQQNLVIGKKAVVDIDADRVIKMEYLE
ncbi:MAG: N-acetylneuraminate synthase family protein [Paludibacteraceae bacterium]|nr:N-acetylneuraminate synthase family protein [Paludibacteraceae bacterium]